MAKDEILATDTIVTHGRAAGAVLSRRVAFPPLGRQAVLSSNLEAEK